MPMNTRARTPVFLIAVKDRRGAPRIYAVRGATPAVALALIREAALDETIVELAGKLSGRLARSLKLEPGEYRFIA